MITLLNIFYISPIFECRIVDSASVDLYENSQLLWQVVVVQPDLVGHHFEDGIVLCFPIINYVVFGALNRKNLVVSAFSQIVRAAASPAKRRICHRLQIIGHLEDLLLGDAQGLVYIETVQVDVLRCVIILIYVVENPPRDIPLDSNLHLLVLVIRNLFLRPLLCRALVIV